VQIMDRVISRICRALLRAAYSGRSAALPRCGWCRGALGVTVLISSSALRPRAPGPCAKEAQAGHHPEPEREGAQQARHGGRPLQGSRRPANKRKNGTPRWPPPPHCLPLPAASAAAGRRPVGCGCPSRRPIVACPVCLLSLPLSPSSRHRRRRCRCRVAVAAAAAALPPPVTPAQHALGGGHGLCAAAVDVLAHHV
jgi:hypothetical protein